MQKILLKLKDNSNYEIDNDLIKKLSDIYGKDIKIAKELKKMQAWLLLNVNNRKTRRGIKRFIANWLNKAMDNINTIDNNVKINNNVNPNDILSKGYAILNNKGMDTFDKWAAVNKVNDYDKECIINAVNGCYLRDINKKVKRMFK
jgi:hypothetical protein